MAFRNAQITKDLYSVDLISHDQISYRTLDGKKDRRGDAGLIALYSFKMEAREYLCAKWLDDRAIGAGAKAKIREVCKSVPEFRKHCGWSGTAAKAPKVDLSWKAGWARSAEKVLDLIEAR